MNGLIPNCMDDFIFSNADEQKKLELILMRSLPFPFAGKNGILLHGVWGTGKTTFGELLPRLLETAHSGTWNAAQGAGSVPAAADEDVHTQIFRCGGGLSSTYISDKVTSASDKVPFFHHSGHNYLVFDEVDRLTAGAQQSLKSLMGLKRNMFVFTTNYLNRVDVGPINRCHLVEMAQATNSIAYLPLGQRILQNMGLSAGVVSSTTLTGLATKAKGSLRDFSNDVVLEGIKAGGVPAF